jgi:hypothetical protein
MVFSVRVERTLNNIAYTIRKVVMTFCTRDILKNEVAQPARLDAKSCRGLIELSNTLVLMSNSLLR